MIALGVKARCGLEGLLATALLCVREECSVMGIA